MNALAAVADRIGPANVLSSQEDMAPYTVDWRGNYRGLPEAVLRPGTTQEVAEIVRRCAAENLAIVPAGSGNGLARHLKIPMNLKNAINIINRENIRKIDTATINDQLFVNVAGVGFDASVAKKFAVAGKRGFSTYLRITTDSYRNYEPKQYTLIIDGKVYKRRALLISFANSSQFGNNTVIDPSASVDDGFIDVCIVGKMPYWKAFFLAPLLFLKKFDQTRYIEIIRAKEVILKRKKGKSIHLDGDPQNMGKELTMRINPLSLNVVVP